MIDFQLVDLHQVYVENFSFREYMHIQSTGVHGSASTQSYNVWYPRLMLPSSRAVHNKKNK